MSSDRGPGPGGRGPETGARGPGPGGRGPGWGAGGQAPATAWRVLQAMTLAAVLSIVGCGEEPTLPTEPSTTTTDTFTGTLAPQGTSSHEFSAQRAGFMTLTVVSLDPLPEITIGVGLGAPSESGCTLQLKNDAARAGSILSASITTPGSYCVAIYDVGNVTEDVSYSIQLIHP